MSSHHSLLAFREPVILVTPPVRPRKLLFNVPLKTALSTALSDGVEPILGSLLLVRVNVCCAGYICYQYIVIACLKRGHTYVKTVTISVTTFLVNEFRCVVKLLHLGYASVHRPENQYLVHPVPYSSYLSDKLVQRLIIFSKTLDLQDLMLIKVNQLLKVPQLVAKGLKSVFILIEEKLLTEGVHKFIRGSMGKLFETLLDPFAKLHPGGNGIGYLLRKGLCRSSIALFNLLYQN
jgi:hypothetical protein